TALENQSPMVALESTIITHGMPFPVNVETALEVEQEVRSEGAVPATIAMIDGEIRVGLEEPDLIELGKSANSFKLGYRDLAIAMVRNQTGGTTVSATSAIAHQVGIRYFATGGIGGVHRGSEIHGDVSADLHELTRRPITIVCAGIKAILDIPKTLELLEHLSVPVVTYGNQEFPAFFMSSSGVPSPRSSFDINELVQWRNTLDLLGQKESLLVALPVKPELELDSKRGHQAIENAIAIAKKENIKGKEITPFLLQKVNELTGGESLKANVALIKANASFAAKLATHAWRKPALRRLPP
ncbi:MAG: pseudouridine-5'-phosphate glycosidase, partial [Bacteroidota bacterium]